MSGCRSDHARLGLIAYGCCSCLLLLAFSSFIIIVSVFKGSEVPELDAVVMGSTRQEGAVAAEGQPLYGEVCTGPGYDVSTKGRLGTLCLALLY